MDSFVFEDIVNFVNRSYRVKTINDAKEKHIINSIFSEGILIKSVSLTYNGHLSEKEIYLKTKQFHESNRDTLKLLFDLSKKLNNSDNINKQLLLGRAFIKYRLYDEAVALFKKLINVHPNLSVLFYYLGRIFLEVQDVENAILYLNRAVELKEQYADYHFYLGKAYIKKQECEKSILQFIQATKINPYFSLAHYYLGLAYIKNAINRENYELAKNVVEDALTCFNKAFQLNPILKHKKFDEAKQELENQNFENAYKILNEAPIHNENEISEKEFIIDFYIKYLIKEERIGLQEIYSYIKKLKSLVVKYAHYADLHHELGIAYVILSKFFNKKAMNCFHQALEINPDYFQAKRKLKLLQNEQRGINILLDKFIDY